MTFSHVHAPWDSYELLDSGNGEKFERFHEVTLVRPEPLALWAPHDPAAWSKAHARYAQSGEEGKWNVNTPLPKNWQLPWKNLCFTLHTTSFKHLGVFPEQAGNWEWITETVKPGQRVLNLFGYTGGATLAASSSGAEVVHVDASKPAVTWAKQNAQASDMEQAPIRWITDDVQKFVARETRRGNAYDAVFLDPPAFGRGPKGEIWKFDEHLPLLLQNIRSILAPQASLLLNAYSLGYPALSIEQLVHSVWPKAKTETVELVLTESSGRAFMLPAGIAVRATFSA